MCQPLERIAGGAGSAKILGKLKGELLSGLRSRRTDIAAQGRSEIMVRPQAGSQSGGVVVRADAKLLEPRPDLAVPGADLLDEAAQRVTLADNIAEQGLKSCLAAALQNGGERICKAGLIAFGGARDHLAACFRDQRFFHLAVEEFEMAGDVGFQRKLMQHRFTEGMDRLDLQSARCLERACKQPPCSLQPGRAWCLAVQLLDRFGKVRIR